jgi:predicted nucleic acid-binding protein
MMEKPAIYVETSVVSYLVARPSRDLIVAAHQQITVEWWRTQRQGYDLLTSQIVIEEARLGDPDTAKKRLAALEGLPLLDVNEEAIHLAQELITSHAVPEKAARDALHIAVACEGGVDYLLTWNCKHIANAKARSLIEQTCRTVGYAAPIMCTPEELED